jgi:hypothetical protein
VRATAIVLPIATSHLVSHSRETDVFRGGRITVPEIEFACSRRVSVCLSNSLANGGLQDYLGPVAGDYKLTPGGGSCSSSRIIGVMREASSRSSITYQNPPCCPWLAC